MGSLSSTPRVSTGTQVVYMPAYSGGGTTTTTPTDTNSDADGLPTPAQARAASLLQRGRGRFGTVLTGFRGLLSAFDTGGARKTLLGE